MAENSATTAQTEAESLQFPLPLDSVFDGLFQHIYDNLWPNWNETERIEFIHRTSKVIVFNKTIRDVDTFVRRPAVSRVLAMPYTIVSVTTGIAIWGLEGVSLRPSMEPFLQQNADRLALFPNTPADGYGQPPRSLEQSWGWYRARKENILRTIERNISPTIGKSLLFIRWRRMKLIELVW